jgi:hypothetical protein
MSMHVEFRTQAMTDASHDRPAILHSLFDLADGVAEEDFKQALEAFFEHLRAKGFARSLRIMRRKPLPEFGARLPDFAYYAAIEFHDLGCEQACYDYVAENSEPVCVLHHAMNSRVRRGAQFFVSADV